MLTFPRRSAWVTIWTTYSARCFILYECSKTHSSTSNVKSPPARRHLRELLTELTVRSRSSRSLRCHLAQKFLSDHIYYGYVHCQSTSRETQSKIYVPSTTRFFAQCRWLEENECACGIHIQRTNVGILICHLECRRRGGSRRRKEMGVCLEEVWYMT